MHKHFVLWYGADAILGWDEPANCPRRLTTWTQTDDAPDVWYHLRALSNIWAREHWCGEVFSLNFTRPDAGQQIDCNTWCHVMFQTAFQDAHLYVPSPVNNAPDSISLIQADLPLLSHVTGVLCDSYGNPALSNNGRGEFGSGMPTWPIVGPQGAPASPTPVHRRSTLWLDAKGGSCLNHFLHVDTIGSGDVLLDQNHCNNATYLWSVSGAIDLVNFVPPDQPYLTTNDIAYLYFWAGSRQVKLAIPGPHPAIFLQDGVRIDDSQVAPSIPTFLDLILTADGQPLTSYIGGMRTHLGPARY